MKMSTSGMESKIVTVFDDIVTTELCTTLISNLIKYILYNKEQLPCTFEHLKYVLSRKKSSLPVKTEVNQKLKSLQIAKLIKDAEQGIQCLESLLERTALEIVSCGSGKVSEVAVMLGSTILTPKQVFRIHLPNMYHGHLTSNHPHTKNMLKLLQSVFKSESFSTFLSKPLNPTNMFLMIRKCKTNSETDSPWLIPKLRYQLPPVGEYFNIEWSQPNLDILPCTCHGFTVFQDQPPFKSEPALPTISTDDVRNQEEEGEMQWYQASLVFKGFKTMC